MSTDFNLNDEAHRNGLKAHLAAIDIYFDLVKVHSREDPDSHFKDPDGYARALDGVARKIRSMSPLEVAQTLDDMIQFTNLCDDDLKKYRSVLEDILAGERKA